MIRLRAITGRWWPEIAAVVALIATLLVAGGMAYHPRVQFSEPTTVATAARAFAAATSTLSAYDGLVQHADALAGANTVRSRPATIPPLRQPRHIDQARQASVGVFAAEDAAPLIKAWYAGRGDGWQGLPWERSPGRLGRKPEHLRVLPDGDRLAADRPRDSEVAWRQRDPGQRADDVPLV